MACKAFKGVVRGLAVLLCLLSVHGASAAAQHVRGMNRKLQATNAIVIAESPKVTVEGIGEVPICSSQRLPDKSWVHGNDAAKLAWQLSQGGADGATADADVWDFCSGTLSNNQLDCYAGDGMYKHTVFVSLSCASKPRCWTNKDGSQACVGKK